MASLTIGKIAKLAGVTAVTLRYYERIQLIPTPQRTTSGYRYYSPDILDRLRFIQRSKALGFTLEEIRDLLSLHDTKQAKSMPIRKKVLEKLDDIESKIKDLKKLHDTLKKLAATCDGKLPITKCPIMEHIFKGDGKGVKS